MRFGFHISISGGFQKVIPRAQQRGCETIQVFSRNPRGWRYGPLNEKDIEIFKSDLRASKIYPLFVHMPYLPNLSSTKKELFQLSVSSLIVDLSRSEFIGAQFLIMHVGSATDKIKGMAQMIDGINKAFKKVENGVRLLLENTAGAGNEIGCRFEQLKEIISGIEQEKRIGVVFDTAHAFEAGYDLTTEKAVDKTIKEFDEIIGLGRLYLIHLNDSKTELGSHADRHWHISKGKIGPGMKFVISHPALKNLPFIMETPRTNLKEDLMNMKTIRNWLLTN